MIRKLLFLVAVFTAASCGQLVGPKVSVQQMEYNFGNITQGTTVSHNFVITNNGGDTLKILQVNPSCGCTAAKPDKSSLLPGESTNLKVDFNSSGKLGKQEKYVFVVTNDASNRELKLKFVGNVVNTNTSELEKSPKIFFTETNHDFGTVPEGQTVDYTFKFKNIGKATLEISKVNTSCGCTAALISEKVLEPGKEGTLKVELDTKNRSGKMSRNITINSNDPEEPIKMLVIYADVNKENK